MVGDERLSAMMGDERPLAGGRGAGPSAIRCCSDVRAFMHRASMASAALLSCTGMNLQFRF